MRVLLCHTYYKQRGGEDLSFEDEAQLLQNHGHEVSLYTRRNDELDRMGSLRAAANTIWNRSAYQEIREQIRYFRPELIHCTNTFPLISPSVYQAAKDEKAPVVQALRNYRLLCPKGTVTRHGAVCEQCLTKRFAWPAIQHACYRESRLASTVVASMLAIHQTRGTWRRDVDRFFTPSRFARDVFVKAGMPTDRIDWKPNCVRTDPGAGQGEGGYALFVGRLSSEKGIATLLEAWRRLPDSIELRIVGDGPDANLVTEAAQHDARIIPLGKLPLGEVYAQLQSAACLVMPSVWYETFGRTIIEAYATATPVIASQLGAMEELVLHGETGLLFQPGSAEALTRSVQELFKHNHLEDWRNNARREYETKYTAQVSYENLIRIYERTLSATHRSAMESAATPLPTPSHHAKPIA